MCCYCFQSSANPDFHFSVGKRPWDIILKSEESEFQFHFRAEIHRYGDVFPSYGSLKFVGLHEF